MLHSGQIKGQTARGVGILATAGLITLLGLGSSASAQFRDFRKPGPDAPAAPKAVALKTDVWNNAPVAPVTSAEIDKLVAKELQRGEVKTAPLTTDEQFIRRASLDLVGRLPVPADVEKFVADKDPQKRAKLIDQLLESDDYAKHWARYWRDVISARVTDRRGLAAARAFENWLSAQLKANTS